MMNIGGYDDDSFFDSNGVAYLTTFLQKEHTIKVIIESDDKIPNLDGTIQLLKKVPKKSIPLQIFHVQVKTLNSDYSNNNKCQNKSQYKYSVDTKIFNIVKAHVTADPVLLFLVDEKNEKVFWFHVSIEYVMGLEIKDEQNKTIYFSDENVISDLSKFHEELTKIHEEKVLLSKNGYENIITTNYAKESKVYEFLNDEWDYLDDVLTNKLKLVTRYMYPDVWRFGIAYQEGDSVNTVGIYKIKKGINDTFIKDFETGDNHCFTICNYKKDKLSIREVINNQISIMLDKFFKRYRMPASCLSNIVLEEIVFHFLDNMADACKEFEDSSFVGVYYKRQESVSEIRRIWNALVLYEIKKNEFIIEKYADTPRVATEINPLGALTSASMRAKTKAREKFLEVLKEVPNINGELPYPLQFSKEFSYELYFDSICELERREIEIVNRPWEPKKYIQMFEQYEELGIKGLDRIETGYLIEDIYSNYEKMLNEFTEAYKFTVKKIWKEEAEERIIRKEYSISFNKMEVNCRCYKATRKSKDFNIVINEYPIEEMKKAMEMLEGLHAINADSICNSSLYSGTELDMPLYRNLWYFINQEMWNRCSVRKPTFGMQYI